MVPCERGKPFDDLTDWKAHSTTTGHCCIYECRKPSSAASIPDFAFETATSSTFMTSRTPAWNAPATSKVFRSEGYHPLSYEPWKGLVSSRLDPTESRDPSPPLLGTVNAPAVSTMHSLKCCSPLPDALLNVPASSTRQPNLATIWPPPVPLTKSQTAAYYQSLNSQPAWVPTTIPHSVMASSTKSAFTPAPVPRHVPPAGYSDPRSTTSSDLKSSKIHTAATPLAPTTVRTSHSTVKSTSDYRPFGCPHCKRAFRVDESLLQHYKDLHPRCSKEVFGPTCDTCKKSFSGEIALEQHQSQRNALLLSRM